MLKRLFLIGLTLLSISAAAQKKSMSGTPDKALMQKIWSGWATLDPANVSQYYATGPHVFFDIAPLKYGSWDEYQANVKTATCTVNDDAQIHPAGDYVWGTATVNYDMVHNSDKHDMGAFRWTVVWHKEGGKWLIVHEHVSEPVQ